MVVEVGDRVFREARGRFIDQLLADPAESGRYVVVGVVAYGPYGPGMAPDVAASLVSDGVEGVRIVPWSPEDPR